MKNWPRAYVILSDIHIPDHSPVCIKAVCDFIEDIKPYGFILNGDILDLDEVSRHSENSLGKLENKRLYRTFQSGNMILDMFDKALGKACQYKAYIWGNHEDRMNRWLQKGDNAVFKDDPVLELGNRLELKRRKYEYVPDADGYVKIGHLVVTHGRFTVKNHAAKHLDYYRHSVVYGHTHTPQMHHASSFSGQQVAIGAGHLANPNSKVMKYARQPNSWLQGFVLVYAYEDGSFNAQPINFFNGRFTYANKTYGYKGK